MTSRSLRRWICFAVVVALLLGGLTFSALSKRYAPASPSYSSQTANLLPAPNPNISLLEPASQRHLQEARSRLEENLNTDDSSQQASAYGALGMLYHAYDLNDAALTCYHNAAALDPLDFRWQYLLGQIERESGATDRAIDRYTEALSGMKDVDEQGRQQRVATYYWLGESHFEAGHIDRAEASFHTALQEDATCTGALVGLGKVASQRNDAATAIAYLEQALRRDPGIRTVHYLLGVEYQKLGQTEKAARHADAAKTAAMFSWTPRDPLTSQMRSLAESSLIYAQRGDVAFQTNQFSTAEKSFRNAIAIDPDNVGFHVKLASTLLRQRRTDEAEAEYLHAIDVEPQSPSAHFGLAVLYSQRGNDREAINHYRQALEAKPDYTDARFNLANSYIRVGQHDDALAYYESVIKLDPSHIEARYAHGLLLILKHRYADARRSLEQSHLALPSQTKITHLLARLLVTCPEEQIRDGQQGIALAEAVFRAEQSLPHVETLAMAYAEIGEFELARKWQEQAIVAARQAGRADLLPRLEEARREFLERRPNREPLPQVGSVAEFLGPAGD